MATDYVPNGRRKIRANGARTTGMATRGNRYAPASADRRAALLETGDFGYAAPRRLPSGRVVAPTYTVLEGRFGDGTLSGRVPVVAAIRPMADASEEGGNGPIARRRGTRICPGCGCEKTRRNAKACFCW